MLFNSYVFIFAFLPLVLLIFHLTGRRGHREAAMAWLVLASLFFYGWWNPVYLLLIAASIVFNYALGVLLTRSEASHPWLLAFGVAANLGALGFFKYADFAVANANALFGLDLPLTHVVLPLAISFFTFQQIAYLVGVYRGETREYHFLHYCLFVTFFPQLIAGPIVHHAEMLPQFARTARLRIRRANLEVGLAIFFIGLFKKTVLADGVAGWATPVFDAAASGTALTAPEAWIGAWSYALQLYFDFSGYSDMAIGLGRLFGIRLPLNFDSPYQAVNAIEFWRRWHMTLSRFLRNYLYIPLGGNRRGPARRYANLMITMLLGGLWHGAGWNFAIWGALHGAYLMLNHGWHALRRRLGSEPGGGTLPGRAAARGLTFLAVLLAWVFFRARDLPSAALMLRAMAGAFPAASLFPHDLFRDVPAALAAIAALSGVVWFAPNSQQIMARFEPGLATYPGTLRPARWKLLRWQPNPVWALLTALVSVLGVLGLSGVSEFLYFQF